MNQAKLRKIGKIALNVLLCLFLAICIFTLIITLTSKKSRDGTAEIFGMQMRIVTTDSMAACEFTDVSEYEIKDIPVHSLVFVQAMPTDPAEADEWYRALKKGDVLTFRYVYNTQVTITHRVTKVTEKDTGGFIIELEGDNKATENSEQLVQAIDTSVPNNPNYVIGKVIGQNYFFGLVLSSISHPIGIACLIILPCVIIVLLELVKIVRVLIGEKKKKEREEDLKKEQELEELRARLAELEKAKDISANTETEEVQKE